MPRAAVAVVRSQSTCNSKNMSSSHRPRGAWVPPIAYQIMWQEQLWEDGCCVPAAAEQAILLRGSVGMLFPHPRVLPTCIFRKGELLLHPQASEVSYGDINPSNQIVSEHESPKGGDRRKNFSPLHWHVYVLNKKIVFPRLSPENVKLQKRLQVQSWNRLYF